MASIYRLPSTLMRGGTSKGLFIRADVLPEDTSTWERMLLRAIGSPDPHGKQIDGLGTGRASTSKVMILSPSRREDCDVDCLFGHVSIEHALIDWSGNCGNLSAAVPLFAVMEKLVEPRDGVASIGIWQANVGKRIIAELEIMHGQPVWQGDYHIDGVAFPGAPIRLRFLDPAGGSSGELYPTGKLVDELALPDGSRVEATLVDAGNPTVFVRARDFGLKGDEEMAALLETARHRLEWAREIAAVVMGLAPDIFAARRERPGSPRISLLSESRNEDCQINARILTSGRSLHHAFTGTGAIALACACATEGTLPQQLAGAPVRGMPLTFSHASGKQTVEAVLGHSVEYGWTISEVVMTRTARPLMRGEVYIPMD